MAFGEFANLLDDFNRADQSPMVGNWAKLDTNAAATNLNLVGNRVSNSGTTTGQSYWTPNNFGPDVEVYFSIPVLAGTNNAFRVAARIQGEGGDGTWDGYEVRTGEVAGGANDQVFIERMTDNLGLVLGAAITQELAADDIIGIRCMGTTIEAWHIRAGVQTLLGQRTDSTYQAAGKVGVGLRGTTGRIDNVYAGTISPRLGQSELHHGGRGAGW